MRLLIASDIFHSGSPTTRILEELRCTILLCQWFRGISSAWAQEEYFLRLFSSQQKSPSTGGVCARLRCGCCRKHRRKSHTQLDVIFSEKRSTEAALGFFLSFHVNNISPPYLPPYSSHRTIPIPPRNSSRYTIYCLTIIEGMEQVPMNPPAIEFRLFTSAKCFCYRLDSTKCVDYKISAF